MGFRNPQETGRPVKIKDEGLTLVNNVASIDLVGAGVSTTALGDDITETINGYAGTAANNEVPTGDIDGVNKVFTLAHTPLAGQLFLVVVGVGTLTEGVDFTRTGAVITFVLAPQSESTITVTYYY